MASRGVCIRGTSRRGCENDPCLVPRTSTVPVHSLQPVHDLRAHVIVRCWSRLMLCFSALTQFPIHQATQGLGADNMTIVVAKMAGAERRAAAMSHCTGSGGSRATSQRDHVDIPCRGTWVAHCGGGGGPGHVVVLLMRRALEYMCWLLASCGHGEILRFKLQLPRACLHAWVWLHSCGKPFGIR